MSEKENSHDDAKLTNQYRSKQNLYNTEVTYYYTITIYAVTYYTYTFLLLYASVWKCRQHTAQVACQTSVCSCLVL